MKALVTGASSGIGRDIARELSNRGYDIIAVARDGNKLNELKEELKTKVEIIAIDISDSESCKMLYNTIQYRDIEVLVNCAGFGKFGEFDSTDLDEEINMIDTNITALHILTKLVLRDMKKKDKGYILNVASIASFMPGPLMATYYATKAYVLRLSESIYTELKKKKSKVSISVLCPGPVETNFNNVADVKFGLKSLSSEYVAEYAVEEMFNKKLIIIPGRKIKIARFLAKISPDKLSARICYHIQKRKNK